MASIPLLLHPDESARPFFPPDRGPAQEEPTSSKTCPDTDPADPKDPTGAGDPTAPTEPPAPENVPEQVSPEPSPVPVAAGETAAAGGSSVLGPLVFFSYILYPKPAY